MKILVLSDIHLEFENYAFESFDADVVVLAGDIHLGDRGVRWAINQIKEIPVIYVLGNHEYYRHTYPKLVRKIKEVIHETNVHLLENESYEIDGVRFHGCTLWTDFNLFGNPRLAGWECEQKMTDFKKIRKEPSYSKIRAVDLSVINKKSVHWLRLALKTSTSKKNIVVTHHAPSSYSLPEKYRTDMISSAYVSNFEPLIMDLKPDVWIHGHLHESSDYMIGATRVVCNPRGYPDEPNIHFCNNFIIELMP